MPDLRGGRECRGNTGKQSVVFTVFAALRENPAAVSLAVPALRQRACSERIEQLIAKRVLRGHTSA
ncbi:MAG: hypothetical protein GY878_01385 [Fuerstiella sp.]|nr:hypothetical protein [Fuerstiella sp.]